jgi:hypothetical protein
MSLLKNWPYQYQGRGAKDDGARARKEGAWRWPELGKKEPRMTVHCGGEGWWNVTSLLYNRSFVQNK